MVAEATERPATQLEANGVTQTDSGTGASSDAADLLSLIDGGVTQAEGGTEAQGGETEAKSADPLGDISKEYLDAEAERRADEKLAQRQAEEAAKKRAEDRKAEEEGVTRAWQESGPRTRNILAQVLNGQRDLDNATANEIMTNLNAIQGAGYRAALAHAIDDFEDAFLANVDDEGKRAELAEKVKRDWRSPPDINAGNAHFKKVYDTIAEHAREGYVPAAKVQSEVSEGRRKLVEEFLTDPAKLAALNSRARGLPESLGGGGAIAGSMTRDQLNALPPSQYEAFKNANPARVQRIWDHGVG